MYRGNSANGSGEEGCFSLRLQAALEGSQAKRQAAESKVDSSGSRQDSFSDRIEAELDRLRGDNDKRSPGAAAATETADLSDLAIVEEAWPTLPASVRNGIVILVRTQQRKTDVA